MNDLEIERRIADIEGIHYIETKGDVRFLALVSENDFTGTPPEMIGMYNPLTDDALLLNLILTHEVTISFNFCLISIITDKQYEKNFHDTDSLKRNILLLIIEANK